MQAWIRKHRYWLLAVAIFIVHSVITYWGVLHYRYPVAPGDDTAGHLQIITSLEAHPVLWPTGGYPPGYHYIIIGLSHLTHYPPYAVMAAVWPMFIILSGVAIFLLAWQYFGIEVALVAYALFALACPQPLQTAYDGGFPDIIATGIFLPLALIGWAKLWQRFRFWPLVGFGLAAAAVVFTHHLSTLGLLGIIAGSAAVLSVVMAFRVGGRRGWSIIGVCVLAVGLLALIFEKTPVFGAARQLLNTSVSGSQSPIWNTLIYGQSLTGLIFQLSFVGAAIGLWQAVKTKFEPKNTGLLIVVVWFGLYFVGSELSFVVQPDRLSRDLALPASLLAAYAIIWLVKWFQASRPLALAFGVAVTLLFLSATLIKTESQLTYNKMIRFSQADVTALHYIDTHGPYPYLVWAQNDFWQFTAAPEIQSNKIQLIGSSQLDEVYAGRSCILLGYYKSSVWLPFTQNPAIIQPYLQDPRLSTRLLAQDPNKVWYLSCLKS